jgi:hypothetical protein
MSSLDLRVVHTAASYIEAQLLVGLLESEGVAARAAGSELMDEFSAAQRLIGPTQVVVKQEDLELASEIVAAWRAYASEDPSSETPPPEDG